MIRSRAGDDRVALRFEGESWTLGRVRARVCQRAALPASTTCPRASRPTSACCSRTCPSSSCGSARRRSPSTVLVGINPTRRGAELARDITHTDCQFIVTEARHLSLLDGLDLGDADGQVLVVDDAESMAAPRTVRRRAAPRRRRRRTRHLQPALHVGHERRAEGVHPLAGPPVPEQLDHVGERRPRARRRPLHDDAAVPLERDHHGVLPVAHQRRQPRCCDASSRRRASSPTCASTASPTSTTSASRCRTSSPRPSSPTTPTTRFASRSATRPPTSTSQRFGERFGCIVDRRLRLHRGRRRHHPQPRHAAGRRSGMPTEGIVILDPETMEECPRARFDADGRLLNPDECIGEIVNKNGAAGFEGYYKNDEANAARIRNGWYWTRRPRVPRRGWLGLLRRPRLRVAAGRRRELRRRADRAHPRPPSRRRARGGLRRARRGSRRPGDGRGGPGHRRVSTRPDFDDFLGEQTDLGTKWSPRYVRVDGRPPRHGDEQVPEARAARRGLGRVRPGLVAIRARRPTTPS